MPPLTLLDYANQRKAAAAAARDAARTAAEQARAAAADAGAAFQKAARSLDAITLRIAAVDRALPLAAARPDRDDLLDERDFLQADLTAARQELAGADARRRGTTAESDRTTAALNEAAAALAQAEARAAAAAAQLNARQAVRDRLQQPPLNTLQADAATVFNGQPLKDADARVKHDIPDKLLRRAKTRRRRALAARKQARDAAAAASTAYLDELVNNAGPDPVVVRRRVELDRTEGRLRTYAATAAGRLDLARTTIDRAANPNLDPLTEAEDTEIHDPTRLADREKAVDEEEKALNGVAAAAEALDQAKADLAADPNNPAKQQAVAAATAALAAAQADEAALKANWFKEWKALGDARAARDANLRKWQDARAAAVAAGSPKPDDVQEVKDAKAELDAALTAYRAAVTDYKKSNAGILRQWDAAVPPAAWRRVYDLEAARDTVTELKDTDPGQLGADVDAADTALATAIQAADTRTDKLGGLAAARDRTATEADIAATRLDGGG